MSPSLAATIRDRVQTIEVMPTIPAVFLPLLKLLNSSTQEVAVEEVVRLVSYDNAIAAQCIRVASSPLFGLSNAPKSIKTAVVNLGMRRVETILLTCCLGQAFPARKWMVDPSVFWRHSLGCAMVCRKFSEKLSCQDSEKAYMAGLLHDIGFMVNCMVFPKEFSAAMERACREEISLDEAEMSTMGFTHAETGRALAERWKLAEDLTEVIAHHHELGRNNPAPAGGATGSETVPEPGPEPRLGLEKTRRFEPLVALVHLSDLLCRMRGLGYGYYERQRVDLISDPAWAILARENRQLETMDLVRFTFELDEAVQEIHQLVAAVFGGPSLRS